MIDDNTVVYQILYDDQRKWLSFMERDVLFMEWLETNYHIHYNTISKVSYSGKYNPLQGNVLNFCSKIYLEWKKKIEPTLQYYDG